MREAVGRKKVHELQEEQTSCNARGHNISSKPKTTRGRSWKLEKAVELPTLGHGPSQWNIGGWAQKGQRSYLSVMSPRRKICPGGWLRLHHRTQVEGVESPVNQVPQVMAREGGMLVPSTCLQHPGDSKVLLEKKRWGDTPGLPGSRGWAGQGPPQKLVCPRYRLLEPEGNCVLGNLLFVMSFSDEKPLATRAMRSIWGR